FLARILFLVSFDPLGWIPVIYVLLIWYYIYHAVRRHDLAEVAATVLPFVLFSIPYAYSATAITLELPATAYGVSLNMFLLLAAAKGAALLYERLGDGWLRGWSSWRVPAAVVATNLPLRSLPVALRWDDADM